MTEKRFTVIDREEPRKQSVAEKGIPCTARHCCTRLNRLTEENEQLKQQLQEEQCRTTPIVLDTHISDEDFKRIEEMLIKHFGKDGAVE